MSSNSDIFKAGMDRAKKLMYEQQKKLFVNIAYDLLFDAYDNWDVEYSYNDMTGNTRCSFVAGVYYNGQLVQSVNVWDVGESKRPTANYSYPGDTIWFYSGNKTLYDLEGRNDELGDFKTESTVLRYEQPYKFQNVGRGSGIDDANKLLNNYKVNSKSWSIVVGVGVPYASYLQNVRHLDVLIVSKNNVHTIVQNQVGRIQKL